MKTSSIGWYGWKQDGNYYLSIGEKTEDTGPLPDTPASDGAKERSFFLQNGVDWLLHRAHWPIDGGIVIGGQVLKGNVTRGRKAWLEFLDHNFGILRSKK